MKNTKAIIISPAWPLRGGIANLAEALSRSMNQFGFDSSIVSFSLQYPSFLFPGKTQYDDSSPPKGISIFTLLNSINPINWISTANFICKQKPELIIVRYWLPFMGPCLGTVIRIVKWKLPNVTVIALTDNVIPHEKRFGDSVFTKYFLKPCDGFIAMSKSVLNDIQSFVNNKPLVFSPHPVYDTFGDKISLQEAREKLNISKEEKVVLFFGIIRKYKGLELLLQAFAIEKVKKLNLKLIIAGEFYDDSQPYLDFIESHQLKNNIVLSNAYIPFEEVKNYFCASNLVVQPYLTATQSGVTQIAYHFNKPMIVTNVGGLPEMVENGVSGYVVNTNPLEIADAIENYFVLDKENEFTENVKVEKKKFDWEYMILSINNLWAEIKKKAK